MKQNLKKIAIILLAILLVLIGAWLFSRRQAKKHDTVPPTFRAFLGLGSSAKPTQKENLGNELSSDFTNEPGTEEVDSSYQGIGSTTPIRSSVFTNAGFSPITSAPPVQGGNISLGTGPGGGSNPPTAGGTTGTPGGTVALPPSDQPECSEDDVSIQFTQDEISRLNVLKSKFFALASSLNTDEDLATEIENYDLFKSKSDKITELYNYCKNSSVFTQAQATIPATQQYGTTVTGPNGATINYRVPTPFWHDLTKDNQAFIHQGNNWMGIFSDPDLVFPERSIEHALRLNLW